MVSNVQPFQLAKQEVASLFEQRYRHELSVDELVLDPESATRFCDYVRRCKDDTLLSDRDILRPLMNGRKCSDPEVRAMLRAGRGRPRQPANLEEYRTGLDAESFGQCMVKLFQQHCGPRRTVDEMLQWPASAKLFCLSVRSHRQFALLPDKAILRPVLNRRKANHA